MRSVLSKIATGVDFSFIVIPATTVFAFSTMDITIPPVLEQFVSDVGFAAGALLLGLGRLLPALGGFITSLRKSRLDEIYAELLLKGVTDPDAVVKALSNQCMNAQQCTARNQPQFPHTIEFVEQESCIDTYDKQPKN